MANLGEADCLESPAAPVSPILFKEPSHAERHRELPTRAVEGSREFPRPVEQSGEVLGILVAIALGSHVVADLELIGEALDLSCEVRAWRAWWSGAPVGSLGPSVR